MLLKGEIDAISTVVVLADDYGYGNLISHLKRAWALKLMAGDSTLTYNQALLATDVPAYPAHWSVEYLREADR